MEKKIAEPKPICLHPEHDPAAMLYRTPGTYYHSCPACGKEEVFTVPQVIG